MTCTQTYIHEKHACGSKFECGCMYIHTYVCLYSHRYLLLLPCFTTNERKKNPLPFVPAHTST